MSAISLRRDETLQLLEPVLDEDDFARPLGIGASAHEEVLAVRKDVPAPASDAYDLYLRGQFFLNKRTDGDLRTAASFFEQAVQRDSGFARAWAALADADVLGAVYSIGPPQALVARARAAALKALALDSSLAEAHTALALIVQNHDWDWATAEREFRRAIALNPAYHSAGWALAKLFSGILVFEWGFAAVQGPMQQEAELRARAEQRLVERQMLRR